MLESNTRRYASRSVILFKDIAGSQIPSHGNTSYNRSWRLEALGQVLPRASPLPIFEYTLICLRLGSSVSATERSDESGIVRRPRRGLYSPSLDISRETTPSSAPDDTTVCPLEAYSSTSSSSFPRECQWSFSPILDLQKCRLSFCPWLREKF